MQSAAAAPTRLDESNKGHQLLKKMGWGGAGLGASEQGIAEPIKGGEIRDRNDMYRGESDFYIRASNHHHHSFPHFGRERSRFVRIDCSVE